MYSRVWPSVQIPEAKILVIVSYMFKTQWIELTNTYCEVHTSGRDTYFHQQKKKKKDSRRAVSFFPLIYESELQPSEGTDENSITIAIATGLNLISESSNMIHASTHTGLSLLLCHKQTKGIQLNCQKKFSSRVYTTLARLLNGTISDSRLLPHLK